MIAVPPTDVDLSVIIVNFNVKAFLDQALRSVQQGMGTLSAEVFVVDNNSVDGSCEMVREEFPEVHLIANKDNRGFATANNQAINQAKGRHLLILNPDTILEESTIPTMVEFLDSHPEAGAVGCKILNPDGSFAPESRRAFPAPSVAFFRMTGLSRLFPKSRIFGRYNMGHLSRDEVAEVDALSGSCMMVRSAALKFSFDTINASHEAPCCQPPQDGAGLLDEGFFMYGEDLDWCYRLQQAGWKIFYTPDTSIIHYKGESTKKNQLRYVRLFHGAMLRFTEKHFSDRYPAFVLWLLNTAVVCRGFVSALMQVIRHPSVRDSIVVLAVMAFLGLFRSVQLGIDFPSLFYWFIAPTFALIVTLTYAILGGYHSSRPKLGSIITSVSLGVLLLSAASFFIKSIAFSRMVVLASLPVSILALAIPRIIRSRQRPVPRKVLVVGDLEDALRLKAAQSTMNRRIFDLVGYASAKSPAKKKTSIPYLGKIHSLRALVQAHEIQTVIFASSSLQNRTIFELMQRLKGLSIETRTLAENNAHIIGKSSVDFLEGAALVESQEALGFVRSLASRRLFDAFVALLCAAVHPFALLGRRFYSSRRFWAGLASRTRRWPELLSGRTAPVGYRESDGLTPLKDWALRPGLFAVTESMSGVDVTHSKDVEQLYWSYVKRQSALVDWLIIISVVRRMYHQQRLSGVSTAQQSKDSNETDLSLDL